jgi:hypothetical protein
VLRNQLEKVLRDQLAKELEHQLARALKDLPAKVLEEPPTKILKNQVAGVLSPDFTKKVQNVLKNQSETQVEEQLKKLQADQLAKELGDRLANVLRGRLASVLTDQLKNVLEKQWPKAQESQLADVLEKQLPDKLKQGLSEVLKEELKEQPKRPGILQQLPNALGQKLQQLPDALKEHLSTVLGEKTTQTLIAAAEQTALSWGTALSKQLQDEATAYFRVGVHEIGHAMGLGHNFKDDGFMNTTDGIAADNLQKLNDKSAADNAALQAIQLIQLEPKFVQKYTYKGFLEGTFTKTVISQANDFIGAAKAVKAVKPFPALIERHFQADDLDRLRFGPDVAVRPGTNCNDCGPLFGDAEPTPADGLELHVEPLLDAIPFGAPARIKLRITNTSSQSQKVPISLGLYTGAITGSVVDPEGNRRDFWPVKKWDDSDLSADLPAYESRTYAMTLLRGAQKSLFPMAGDHCVKVRATWQCNGNLVCLDDQTTVHVAAPVDENHRASALKILSTPDTLFSVAIIGDHVIEGNDAIASTMTHPVLGPHFAIIRAKLLLTGPNNPDPEGACDLINDNAVMSFDEIDSVCQLLQQRYQPGRDSHDPAKLKEAVLCLHRKIAQLLDAGSIEAQRAETTSKRLNAIVSAYP